MLIFSPLKLLKLIVFVLQASPKLAGSFVAPIGHFWPECVMRCHCEQSNPPTGHPLNSQSTAAVQRLAGIRVDQSDEAAQFSPSRIV